MSTPPRAGTIHRINVSDGGVPKLPVAEAEVGVEGLSTDRQAHPRFHGGPERAVCLLGLDAIERLQAEGHPIQPGTTGENVTVAGLDWSDVVPGVRLAFAEGVELEVLSYASPCAAIRASFEDGRFKRMLADQHPGESRVYARVLEPGTLRVGEACTLHLPQS
ncbi:MAG: MOSC domain-containing protein [Planctomycetota bacterium]|nr:MOSC domain-containing protein [Planctomycetota bacterium]